MKLNLLRTRLVLLSILAIAQAALLSGCRTDDGTETTTYHTRILVQQDVNKFRAQKISVQAVRPLQTTGKIYIYGDYLFIIENTRGIHIFDNRNPAFPHAVSFLPVPGASDIAIKDNILYVDSYVDLLAFNLANPANPGLVKRVTNVYEDLYVNQAKTTFRAYKDTVIVRRSDSPHFIDDALASYTTGNAGGGTTGTGGSTARFTLLNNRLYTVDNNNLRLFDVTNAQDPRYTKLMPIGNRIETIFPYGDKLFIGSNTGMHIYSAADPDAPVKLSTYQHVVACDPVIVEGNYAFVTLRSGTVCMIGQNLLQVVDLSDIYHPKAVATFPMQRPQGLTISGSTLFICENEFGLKAFNKTDVTKIGSSMLQSIKTNSVDVIAGPRSLIVTGADGVYQYEAKSLHLLSQIRCLKQNDPYLYF